MIIVYEHGDPVRLQGRRGLFRFVEYEVSTADRPGYDCLACGPAEFGTWAEVIDPRKEISRTVLVSDLVYPGPNATSRDVASHPGVRELSERAHSRSKRR